jgi:hypothetical protein
LARLGRCREVFPITRQLDSADRPAPPGRVEIPYMTSDSM